MEIIIGITVCCGIGTILYGIYYMANGPIFKKRK